MSKKSYGPEETDLDKCLEEVTPENLKTLLEDNASMLLTGPHPFADYMRRKFREKGILQQNVFLAADLSENYGYKLISEEKHTRQRDTVLRICLAARFRIEEVQEALILYGMAPLYGRFPRDAVLLTAFRCGMRDIRKVNRLLEECGQKPLLRGYD